MAQLREDLLRIDAAACAERIEATLRQQLGEVLHRRGFVLGISGGVDSSVCARLAVRAVGREHVLGLFLPERESDPESRRLFDESVAVLGIPSAIEDITAILE